MDIVCHFEEASKEMNDSSPVLDVSLNVPKQNESLVVKTVSYCARNKSTLLAPKTD